jgi:hypothetical protein
MAIFLAKYFIGANPISMVFSVNLSVVLTVVFYMAYY